MDATSRAAALSRYWDARDTSAPVPAPEAALAATIAALEAAALAQPAPDFVAALERRLDLAAPRLPGAGAAAGVALGDAPPRRRLSPVPPRPVSRRRALVAGGRVPSLLAVAAVLALAVVGVLATLVMDGARPGPDPDLRMAAAPPAYPDFSGARPAFLRIPRWEAGIAVYPVDPESAIDLMQTNFQGIRAAGWDFASARPDTPGAVVIALPIRWPANTLASGDEVEVITSDFMVYRYQLDDPVAVETDNPNILADVAPNPDPRAALVLIGPDPRVDPINQVPAWRVIVRGRLVGSAPLPVLARPPAPDCDGAARTIASLEAVVAQMRSAPPTVTEVADFGEDLEIRAPVDEPADAETRAAVVAAATEFVACVNANDPLRLYGRFSDAGIASLFEYFFGASLPSQYVYDSDFTELAQPTTPVADSSNLALIDVTDTMVLPDGRVTATVWVGFFAPAPPVGGIETRYLVPVVAPTLQVLAPQPDGTYLIDDIRYAPSTLALD